MLLPPLDEILCQRFAAFPRFSILLRQIFFSSSRNQVRYRFPIANNCDSLALLSQYQKLGQAVFGYGIFDLTHHRTSASGLIRRQAMLPEPILQDTGAGFCGIAGFLRGQAGGHLLGQIAEPGLRLAVKEAQFTVGTLADFQ